MAATTPLKFPIGTEEFPWQGFRSGLWHKEIDVKDFIQQNYTPYEGDGSFLKPATLRTLQVWGKLQANFAAERRKGALDVSLIPAWITAHPPGYIDCGTEVIVGLQTDAPLRRAIMPNALFDAYTSEIRRCRSSHILTGLPDAYGRGRISGDYRRVALYGVKRLVERKRVEKSFLDSSPSSEAIIRDREELAEQIRALEDLQQMAKSYGFDISRPATNGREAVQWLYFGYLAGVNEQDGAAMPLGRTSTFLDIYFERDIAGGVLAEEHAQEIIDDFVIKLRIVRFLRTPEYDELLGGDTPSVTDSIGGMGDDGRTLVTRTSFRFLQTLYNLGPALEPNLTIRYSPRLPYGFRRFTAKVAVDTSSVQFESDETLHRARGDDGTIACCVSPMLVGKQMQFFGACANLAKCLLYAINGGRDEMSGEQIVLPAFEPVQGDVLEFDDALGRFERMMDWLAGVYANTVNTIHYMHDKYLYERVEMALHDYAPLRTMAFGIAGLSVVADSLSAIKYATVRVVRDTTGLVTDYDVVGEFPLFGSKDNRVDHIAVWTVRAFMKKLRKYRTYRHALHTQSLLTTTSNVVCGKTTGNTPDGRRRGEPFAPGANPAHGCDSHGIHAPAASVGKTPYREVQDGRSLTAALAPGGPRRIVADRIANLTILLDAFFAASGYHVNVNVLNRESLMDSMDHPKKYPNRTLRVLGYAVNFVRREQQMDVIVQDLHGE